MGCLQHFLTEHPTSAWIVQQLREAFTQDRAPQYLVFDRYSKFKGEVAGIPRQRVIRTACHSNLAERGGGTLSFTSGGRPPLIAMMRATDARQAHDCG
jgi:hypothetical protein